ncbi:E4 [Human papillomavirus 197]|uniref:E4 n=1 Tax=Human papillomavirus 197 TaxID=1542134 RepID=A0A088FQM2_9PAPI|nr:E4 [Human papillomavirus 197]
MACIIMKLVVTEFTLHCLMQMHKTMDTPGCGVCILNMKLFPPSAPPSNPLLTPGRPPVFPLPPKSPYPPRKAPDDSKNRRSGQAPGRRLQFDEDDDNKENLPPKENQPPPAKDDEEEEEELIDLVSLLKQLGHDIDLLQHRIYRDLSYLKKRLGIHQS